MQIINICHDNLYQIEDANNVDIANIGSIPNFSASNIHIAFLNRMQKQQAIELIVFLLQKLRIGGSLAFRLLDFNKLIQHYTNEDISKDQICEFTNRLHCLISRGEIIEMFHKDPNINISSITYDSIYNVYTLSRTQL